MGNAAGLHGARVAATLVLTMVTLTGACAQGDATSPTTVRTAPIVKTLDELKKALPASLQPSFKPVQSDAPGSLVEAFVTATAVRDLDGSAVSIDLQAWESVAKAEAIVARLNELTFIAGADDRCGNVTISFVSGAKEGEHLADPTISDIKDSLTKAGFPC